VSPPTEQNAGALECRGLRRLGIAVITGASSGIGLELAILAARAGYNLVIAAEDPGIHEVADDLRRLGVTVNALQVDLSSGEGVETLLSFITKQEQVVELLIANAGTDLGGAFLEQDIAKTSAMIDLNVKGTVALIYAVARGMTHRKSGKILITASIVSVMPGPYHSVYCASKAFLYSFAHALRRELQQSGVSVTCLMPGVTDTAIYKRAGMLSTYVGRAKKSDPAKVARVGFDAMISGKAQVVPGLLNKALTSFAAISPLSVLTSLHAIATRPRTKK